METQEILDKEIGTQEKQMLKPSKVKVVSVRIKDKTNEGKEMKTPLLELRCKHPDNEELIDFTKVKLERNGQLIVASTWISLDDDKKIQKSSTIASLLNFLNIKTIKELYNKEIDTIEQSKENKYLCLKAY